MGMTGRRGLTLIEVVIVLAIIGLSLGLAGPQIGAGLGRLELNTSARTVNALIKTAKLEAQRKDRQHYVVFDKTGRSISVLGSDLKLVRREQLPSSVDFIFQKDVPTAALYVSPVGIIRGAPVRLRGRVGETEVSVR
jgi:prepilin-type N-terminal cleavage/methylation domain-containing protein